MQPLKIAIVQTDLIWEDIAGNMLYLGEQINNIENVDVIVLPEMFATGFTMNPKKNALKMDSPEVITMLKWSMNRAVCGSLAIEENGIFYNRFIWAENGVIKAIYNKRHLFSHGAEQLHYTAGTKKEIIYYKGWKIVPFICYDLRFPVWCRNTEKAELMLFVANWPQVRIIAWEKLLQARAIENQCFVIGVNRVGKDGNIIDHNGSSMLCNAWGDIEHKLEDLNSVDIWELNADKLLEFRQQFPVLEDRDAFSLE